MDLGSTIDPTLDDGAQEDAPWESVVDIYRVQDKSLPSNLESAVSKLFLCVQSNSGGWNFFYEC